VGWKQSLARGGSSCQKARGFLGKLIIAERSSGCFLEKLVKVSSVCLVLDAEPLVTRLTPGVCAGVYVGHPNPHFHAHSCSLVLECLSGDISSERSLGEFLRPDPVRQPSAWETSSQPCPWPGPLSVVSPGRGPMWCTCSRHSGLLDWPVTC
jgi:hypothetical protein